MDAKQKLRILILEDVPSDADLMEGALRQAGFAFSARRTDTREGFIEALKSFRPDVVLCDYKLPKFDGLSAIKLVREKSAGLPVIAVTGELGDEAAAALIRAGANDFILKDRLARLGAAVERAMTEAPAIHARAEAERKASEEAVKYRSLVEQAIAGVYIIREDESVAYINTGFATLCGYAPAEAIGKPFHDFIAESDRAAVVEAFAKQITGRRPSFQIAAGIRRKDGAIVNVLANGSLASYEGRPAVMGVLLDVSERKRAEEALRKSAAEIEDLYNNAPCGYHSVDENGVFVRVNDTELNWLGYRRDELVGKARFVNLCTPETQKAIERQFPALKARGWIKDIDLELIRKDRTVLPVMVSATVVRDETGKFIMSRTTLYDMTDRRKAQTAVNASERRYRRLFECAKDGILILDADTGRIVNVNPFLLDLLGQDYQYFIGKELAEIGLFKDQEQSRRAFKELQAKRYIRYEDLPLQAANGKQANVEFISNTYDEGGKDVIQCNIRDITERKLAEASLRASEARYRALIEQAPEAILVYDLDEDRFVDANRNAERLFGCDRAELQKAGSPRFYLPVQPDGRPISESFAEHNRQVAAGEAVSFERWIRNAKGEDIICDVRLSPLPSAMGRLVRSSFIDITMRKRAETALRDEEAKFRGLVEQEIAGVVIVREDGTLAYVNPQFAKMVGCAPGELIGRPLLEMVPPGEQETVQETIRRQLAGDGGFVQIASRLATRNGGTLDILINASHSVYEGRPASIAVVLDISDLRRAERSLDRLNRALRTLSSGNEALVRAANEQNLLDGMCRTLVKVGGYRMACISLVEHDAGKTVRPVAWAGDGKALLDTAKITWADVELGRGPTGTAIRTGEPQINPDFATNPSMAPWRSAALELGFASSMALPLKDASGVLGALTIYSAELGAFNSEEVGLLVELSDDLSFGIAALRDRRAREEGERQLRDSMRATIGAISGTVEARDPYTAGHQQRAARIAAAIAREMGLPEMQIQGLYLAGIIHDVGKISVPAEILSKPGKLSKAEAELVQAHPQSGYDILKDVAFPWPIAQIVLQHHERIDGSGYPRGLAGEAILIEARILAVADVVEAMNSHRPYRSALGPEVALAEIEKGAGRLYDNEAVQACLMLFRERGLRFD